jgi:hypothetical protein
MLFMFSTSTSCKKEIYVKRNSMPLTLAHVQCTECMSTHYTFLLQLLRNRRRKEPVGRTVPCYTP